MNSLDIIFLVITGIGFAFGCFKGIIQQLSFGAGVIVGLLQAILYYRPVGVKVYEITGFEPMICYIIGFFLLFLIVVLLFKLVGSALKWFINLVFLGFADRVLGGLLTGLITCFLFVGVVSLINTIDDNNALFGKTSQDNSMLYKPMRSLSVTIIDEVKKEVYEKKQ